MFISDGSSSSHPAVRIHSQDAGNENHGKQSQDSHQKEQAAMAGAVAKRGFIGEVAELMTNPSGGSWKGDFGKAAAGAGGAALDTLLELEISKHVNSQLAKDVFAPNIVESMGIGFAASRLPDKRLAATAAVGAWVYGRVENYFESKYHVEEKIGSVGHELAKKIWFGADDK